MSTLHSADGTVIAYEKGGEGPPVILVDGALCHRASGPARPLAKALADRFTVYTYDRRGRGRGESGDSAPYAVEREIEDLQALVDDTREPIALDYEGLSRRQSVRAFLRAVGVPGPLAAMLSHMGKLTAVAHTLPYDAAIVGPHQLGAPLPTWDVDADTLVIVGGKSHAWMLNANRALAEATCRQGIPRSAGELGAGARYRVLEGQNHMVKAKALAPHLSAHFDSRHPLQV